MSIVTNPKTINPFEALNASAQNPTNQNTPSSAEEIQNRFLKLLTAQLQNQTPENPLDNAQMTAQFAQISMLQGIEKLNSTFEKIMSNQASVAANLVGKSALVNGNTLKLGDNITVDLPDGAESVQIEVLDKNGNTIFVSDFGPRASGLNSFDWDGTLTDISGKPTGKKAQAQDENGKNIEYSYVVKAKDKEGKVAASSPKHYQKITSVSWDSKGQVVANLKDGSKVELEQINNVGI